MKAVHASFRSFDGQESCTARYSEPDRHRLLEGVSGDPACIARGAGLSYVGASFGEGVQVVGMASFNRILSLEPGEGETALLEAEAGATVGQLFSFLRERGYWLPVQPGHPAITIGGCIAANVHGKNQFRAGSFSDCVEELELRHPRKGLLRARPGEAAFELSCGGFGLTGIIIAAKLRVQRLPATAVAIRKIAVSNLADCAGRMLALSREHEFLYSWNDLSLAGPRFGRGVIVAADFIAEEKGRASSPRASDARAVRRRYPIALHGRATARLMNEAYYRVSRGTGSSRMALDEFLFPAARRPGYFAAFGRGGFQERQMLIGGGAVLEYLERFQRLCERHRPAISLASMKAMRGRQRHLRFLGEGLSLSIDAPAGALSSAFHSELDELNVRLGALDDLFKDSRVGAALAASEYSELGEYRDALAAFDPERVFQSSLSRRLRL